MSREEIMAMVKDRSGNIIGTDGGQSKALEFLYDSIAGNIALKGLKMKTVSQLAGAFCDSAISQSLIPRFIETAGIDLTEYEAGYYNSFNDFFTRKINDTARPIDMTPGHLVSPCDSKLTVYPIDDDSIFEIKGVSYHIDEFLKSDYLADNYKGGHFCVFRLEVGDYHRYMYIDDGFKSKNRHINGFYHTVNPIALESTDIYKENTREYTILHTENFGRVIMAEVGAMLVGRIVNHHKGHHRFRRGDEKGMFKYGGSTVVLLFEKDIVEFDEDILCNTRDGYETIVKMGEKIGIRREN